MNGPLDNGLRAAASPPLHSSGANESLYAATTAVKRAASIFNFSASA
jgi:hypothetical protein